MFQIAFYFAALCGILIFPLTILLIVIKKLLKKPLTIGKINLPQVAKIALSIYLSYGLWFLYENTKTNYINIVPPHCNQINYDQATKVTSTYFVSEECMPDNDKTFMEKIGERSISELLFVILAWPVLILARQVF